MGFYDLFQSIDVLDRIPLDFCFFWVFCGVWTLFFRDDGGGSVTSIFFFTSLEQSLSNAGL